MKKVLPVFAVWSLPVVALAQDLTPLQNTISQIGDLVNAIIPILVALASLYFIYGVVKYVVAKGPEDKERARDTIIYGIIGLFAVVAVWGIIALLANLLGVETGGAAPDFDVPTAT